MKKYRSKRRNNYRRNSKTGGTYQKKYKFTKKNYKKLKMLPILAKKTQHSLLNKLKRISNKFNF